MDLSRIYEPGDDHDREGKIELDTHADTCVARVNFRLIEKTGETITISPYSHHYKPIHEVPIASVVTVYTCPQTRETIILEGHQHLYFGDKLDHSLWNPNQLQHFGMKVYDCLKQFDLDSMFCMALEDEGGNPVEIPLQLNGIIQYINTHYPTEEEMENCHHVVVTSDEPWDPYSKDFEENERATQVHDHYRVLEVISRCNMVILAVTSEAKGDLFDHLQDVVTGLRIEESRDEHQIASVLTEEHTPEITEEVLAKWWGIGLETAK